MSDKVVTKRTGNFTTIDNKLINDARLSFKAKGLMLYMLSKPDNWNYNVKGDICKRSTDGQSSVYSAINELVKFGYISRVKSIDGYMTYNLFENCDDNDIPDYSVKQVIDSKPNQENPNQENPNQENPNQENPNQENPNQENLDVLIRKNSTNTECSNTHCSNLCDKPTSDRFEEFWTTYPKARRINKKKCLATWTKQGLDSKADLIIERLKNQVTKQYQHTEARYIPHALTYLNGERWEDEVTEIKPPKPKLRDLSNMNYEPNKPEDYQF